MRRKVDEHYWIKRQSYQSTTWSNPITEWKTGNNWYSFQKFLPYSFSTSSRTGLFEKIINISHWRASSQRKLLHGNENVTWKNERKKREINKHQFRSIFKRVQHSRKEIIKQRWIHPTVVRNNLWTREDYHEQSEWN